MTQQHSLEVSIVIPVYNEEGNIGPLIESISSELSKISHEIIVVNDGSTDGTVAEAQSVALRIPNIQIINLKRNFGQTAGLAAGIDHATGKVIIPMDGDRQNDPSDIPRLLEAMKGVDVVSGWRKDRRDKFLTRILPSKMANAIISSVSGVYLHDYGCSLKAYRASTIKNVQLAGEMHRFLPAWCAWQGGKVTEIAVKHHPRRLGQSKYGLSRTFKVIIDLFTLKFFSGYLSKPNYLFSGAGLLSLMMSFLTVGLALFDKYGPDKYPQYRIPLLLLSAFFGLSALFLVLMGLLSEILARLYFTVRQQKPYCLADE
jgi:dolichol-phosphate mannosyltransferase